MDNLETAEQRAERFKRWLADFGFSARDWRRMRAQAEETTVNWVPAALDDLDAPFRVQALPDGHRRWSGGRLLGYVTGPDGHRRALLYWPMTAREREGWARRRAQP